MCHHLKNDKGTNFIFIQKGKCLFSLGHRYSNLCVAVLLPNGLRACTVLYILYMYRACKVCIVGHTYNTLLAWLLSARRRGKAVTIQQFVNFLGITCA